MLSEMHIDADEIIKKTIEDTLPHNSVIKALEQHNLEGNIYLLAIGKAAWSMAKTASDYYGSRIEKGIVITKYHHSEGEIADLDIFEAGHPVLDENSFIATQKAIELAESLKAEDKLVFLISGGGSALFENPLYGISLEDIKDITDQLLSVGADIVEINTVRKRLSSVKGGRFAQTCSPTQVYTVVLSDVLGDRLDSIASGPVAVDNTTTAEAKSIIDKYNLKLTEPMLAAMRTETPKKIDNVENIITGSVTTLCKSASETAEKLGYTPYILSSNLDCEASEAGKLIASMAKKTDLEHTIKRPYALIFGGETIVHLKGDGLGGRNQELALSAAVHLDGTKNSLLFSLGSDGTDGPTDAAGGMVDSNTLTKLKNAGLDINDYLSSNDSYNALKEVDGLILTGPTGTNVNDVTVLLCK